MIGRALAPNNGKGDRYPKARHTHDSQHFECHWQGLMKARPKPHDDHQRSIGRAKPAEQAVQTDITRAQKSRLHGHEHHPTVKDRGMDAEQNDCSSRAVRMQQSRSNGAAEPIGDEHQH